MIETHEQKPKCQILPSLHTANKWNSLKLSHISGPQLLLSFLLVTAFPLFTAKQSDFENLWVKIVVEAAAPAHRTTSSMQYYVYMHPAHLFSHLSSVVFFLVAEYTERSFKINSFRTTTVNGYKWHCYNQIGCNNGFRKMCANPLKKWAEWQKKKPMEK